METKRLSSMVPLVDIVEAERRESAGGQRMSGKSRHAMTRNGGSMNCSFDDFDR